MLAASDVICALCIRTPAGIVKLLYCRSSRGDTTGSLDVCNAETRKVSLIMAVCTNALVDLSYKHNDARATYQPRKLLQLLP